MIGEVTLTPQAAQATAERIRELEQENERLADENRALWATLRAHGLKPVQVAERRSVA